MAHVLKLSAWESGGGNIWYVSDVEDLGHGSGYWYYIPAMLGLSPVDYVKMLKEKYGACNFSYNMETDYLHFAFPTLVSARKFKNEMNKIARQKNWVI